MMELSTTHLLDLSHTLAGEYLKQFVYPWQALEGISDLILTLGAALPGGAHGLSGSTLHHRAGDGVPPRSLCPRFRSGGGKLCGRQLCGAEKRHSL